MARIHKSAQIGFNAEASTYTQGRPDYPSEIHAWLRDRLGCKPGTHVIDLGAGTGKFTRQLVSANVDVIAIEPVEAMRIEFAKHMPGITVLDGTAESIPLQNGTADAVVCAQAFHWFANDAALSEIHRILQPEGRLGLIWNVRDESVDWVAAITQIIAPYEGDTPRFHTGDWRHVFKNSHFSEPELTCFNYTHSGSAQSVIMDRFLSVSFIAAQPASEKANVADQLMALINTHPALRGRDTVVFPYQTQAYLCKKHDV